MPVGNNLNLKRETVIPQKKKKSEKEPSVKDLAKKDLKKIVKKEKRKKDILTSGKKVQKIKVKKEKAEGKKATGDKKDKAKIVEPIVSKAMAESPVESVQEIVSTEVPEVPVTEEKGLLEILEEEQSTRYTIEIIPSKRKAVKKTKVVFSGELTIGNSSAIHEKVASVFDQYELIDFSLKEVRELDLSIIQMLYAYKRDLEKAGKTVNITADLPREIKHLVQLSGFSPILYPTRN